MVGLLLVSSAVAALAGPEVPSDRVEHALATAQGRVDAAVERAEKAVPAPPAIPAPTAPPLPSTSDVPAGPEAPGVVPAIAAYVGAVDDALAKVVGTDVIALGLELAKKAKTHVDETMAELEGVSSSDGTVSDSESVQPQTAAAVPEGSLVMAGTVLVIGAAAAAATYVALWLAGSSSTLGAGAASAATPEMRRLLPFASPLFTRFERDTVLGHPRREQLYAKILEEPGISLQDLGEATGLSRTAVVHHLRLLEQQHLVISRRVGRSRHYYENGGRYGHDQKEAYAILRNDRSKAVADFIKAHPGTMQKSLCEALAIPPSIAHWHVRRLQEGGLVQSIRQGRAVAYFPGAALSMVSGGPMAQAIASAPTA